MVSTPELRNRQTVHNVNVNCQLWSLLIICGFLHNVRFWTVGFGTLGIQINYDLLLRPKSYFPAFLCVTLNLFLMWKLWMLLRDMVQWFAFDLRCPLYLLQCRRLRCRIFWKVQSPASSRSRATRATYMDSPIPRIRRCLHGRPPCVVHRVKGVLWNWDRHHHSWASERDLVIERHILVRLNWGDRRSELWNCLLVLFCIKKANVSRALWFFD